MNIRQPIYKFLILALFLTFSSHLSSQTLYNIVNLSPPVAVIPATGGYVKVRYFASYQINPSELTSFLQYNSGNWGGDLNFAPIYPDPALGSFVAFSGPNPSTVNARTYQLDFGQVQLLVAQPPNAPPPSPPTIFSVSGGGEVLAGIGVDINLSGSESDVTYQLKRSGSIVDSKSGTGNPISFTNITTAGSYAITGVRGSSSRNMSGPVTVVVNGDNEYMVGNISSKFGVSSTGTASFTIPLDILPGRAGMEPSLSLVYNSRSPNGLLGMGWTLSGLSSITRGNTNHINDGYIGAIDFSSDDKLYLDGQRLIAINGTYGASGTEYRTEIESFSKIISYGNINGFPEKLKVWTKDGKILEYGYTTASRVEAQGKTDVLFWNLNKVTDVSGNYILYNYFENNSTGISYISSIQYTGHPNQTSIFNTIIFSYRFDRTDDIISYIEGSKQQATQLLSSIKCTYQSQEIKEYKLEYSLNDMYSHLTSIHEENADGDKIKSTKIDWGEQTTSFETNIVSSSEIRMFIKEGPAVNYKGVNPVYLDYNNDGLTDVLVPYLWTFINNPVVFQNARLFKNNGSGNYSDIGAFSLNYSTHEYAGLMPGDFNGDQRMDFLILMKNRFNANEYILSLRISNANGSFSSISFSDINSLGLLIKDDGHPEFFADDFNGDGTTEVMVFFKDDEEGYHSQLYDFDNNNLSISRTDLGIISSDDDDKVYCRDIDGNGTADIIDVGHSSTRVYTINNSGNVETIFISQGFPHRGLKDIYWGDFNGDGKSEPLTWDNKWSEWRIGCNTGTAFTSVVHPNLKDLVWHRPFGSGTLGFEHPHQYVVSDFNGDGKDDIFEAVTNLFTGETTDITVFYMFDAKPTPLISESTTLNRGVGRTSTMHTSRFNCQDCNGDGKTDIMMVPNLDGNDPVLQTLLQIKFHPHEKKHLVHKLTNGLGTSTNINYNTIADKTISDLYTSGSGASYPAIDFCKPLMVVSSIEQDNGIGGQLTTNYKYEGAKIHTKGRGFLGFNKFTQENEQTKIKVVSEFEFDNVHFIPYMKQNLTYIDDGGTEKLLQEVTNERIINNLANGGVFSYLNKTNTKSWDLDGTFIKTSRKLIDYSPTDLLYGNPTTAKTFSDPANLSLSSSDTEFDFESTQSMTYMSPDASNWFISRPDVITTTHKSQGQSDVVHKVDYDYFSAGHASYPLVSLQKNEEGISTTLYTRAAYTYDNYGNKLTETISAPGSNPALPNLTSTYEYSSTYKNRFVTKETNPLGHFASLEYDPKRGSILKKTDANGFITEMEYDRFGRLSKTTNPDQTTSINALRWVESGDSDAPANAAYYKWMQASGVYPVKVYLNKLARELRTVNIGYDGSSIYTDVVYDQLGRKQKQSIPYFASTGTPVYTINTFDALGRVKVQTLPDTKTITYTYEGLESSVKNANNQITAKTKNAAGWLIRSEDANGKAVVYTHYGDGKVKTTAIDGIAATMIQNAYDVNGNVTSLNDPNLGLIQFQYNAYSQLVSKTDARSNLSTYTYDLLGRVLTETIPEGTTTYVYDTKTKGLGQISTVSNGINQLEYWYDNLGRINKTKDVVDGEDYVYEYTYNELGQKEEIIYPTVSGRTAFSVKYDYLKGYLRSIKDASNDNVLWTTDEINALGQITENTLGNGLNTSKTFDPLTGRITDINTEKNGNVLQDFNYGYDNIGNLAHRQDDSHTSPLVESFTYDPLNRLDVISLNGLTTLDMGYDANGLGNITAKPDAGNFVYGENNAGPHALTTANNYTSKINTGIQKIDYTSFDKIKGIMEVNGTVEDSLKLFYGIDKQRIMQEVYIDEQLVKSKYFIGGLYEKTIDDNTTTEVHYIKGPEGIFAAYERDATTASLNYLLFDHLGSIHHITDENGLSVQELSFDAWGNRRNPLSWTAFTTTPSLIKFDRGYTGHEHLPQFSLINMNGRVYDPVLGRFLSPDPFIQAPDFTQSLNRYSYCFNNPLIYTDPDGENPLLFFLMGAYITGAAINNWNFNPFEWKNFDVGLMLLGGIGGVFAGQSIVGLFQGTTNLSIGLSLNNVVTTFANFGIKNGSFLLKGLGYATAAGGGVYLTKSAIDNAINGNNDRNRISNSRAERQLENKINKVSKKAHEFGVNGSDYGDYGTNVPFQESFLLGGWRNTTASNWSQDYFSINIGIYNSKDNLTYINAKVYMKTNYKHSDPHYNYGIQIYSEGYSPNSTFYPSGYNYSIRNGVDSRYESTIPIVIINFNKKSDYDVYGNYIKY